MEQEKLIDLLWKYFPITEILIASVMTSIVTHAIAYFFPENHKVLKPKVAVLVASAVAAFVVVQFEAGIGLRAYIFNICAVWGVSVAFYEYGGSWLLNTLINFLPFKAGKKSDNPPSV